MHSAALAGLYTGVEAGKVLTTVTNLHKTVVFCRYASCLQDNGDTGKIEPESNSSTRHPSSKGMAKMLFVPMK
jgi:hypothetical protein